MISTRCRFAATQIAASQKRDRCKQTKFLDICRHTYHPAHHVVYLTTALSEQLLLKSFSKMRVRLLHLLGAWVRPVLVRPLFVLPLLVRPMGARNWPLWTGL